MHPAVSVLIDTHNHERYVEQAILSVLGQDFPASEVEIVVVDDGSTDRTAEIVGRFAPRVRLLQKKNGGQASAFNAAIPELRAEVVSLLDGDDWFAPAKLRLTMEALEANPEVAAAGHGFYEFHEAAGKTVERIPDGSECFNLASPEAARDARRGWPFLIVGALTVRKRALAKILPINEGLTFCADGPIALGSIAQGICIFRSPLCFYRHHATNLHATGPTDDLRARRRFEVNESMFEAIEPLLLGLGVSRECVAELLYPTWIPHSREGLTRFGTGRRRAFRTEIRAFQLDHKAPTLAYRVFKYASVGAATMVLPPSLFYKAKGWYSRRSLGRLGQILARGR